MARVALSLKSTQTGAAAVARASQPSGGFVPANAPARSAWGGSKLNTIQEVQQSPITTKIQNTPSQAYVPPGLRAQRVQPSKAGSQAGTGAAGIAQAMNNLSLERQQQQVFASTLPQGTWDPSVAPAPPVPASKFTAFPKGGLRTHGPSGFTVSYGRSNKQMWLQNDVCVKSPYRREDFKQGQVIAVPFHVANMDENADIGDDKISHTIFGPVISKRRMFIIIHVHLEGYFCLPLYSFGKRGMLAKRGEREIEYVQIRDEAIRKTFKIQSTHYQPIDHVHDNPNNSLSADTVCHLTGGVRIGWQEQILTVGRLTKDSYKQLLGYYKSLCARADEMPWEA